MTADHRKLPFFKQGIAGIKLFFTLPGRNRSPVHLSIPRAHAHVQAIIFVEPVGETIQIRVEGRKTFFSDSMAVSCPLCVVARFLHNSIL